MAYLLHEIVTEAAWRTPSALALRDADRSLNYTELEQCVQASAQALLGLGLQRGERVAVLLERCEEAVLAMFGAAAAGGAFVPINPALKPEQVAHILRDSGACILLVAPGQRALLDPVLGRCPALRCVVQTGGQGEDGHARPVLGWDACLRQARSREAHRVIETDLAAILYTWGGPAYPKGMVLTHRKLLAGADSLARCLGIQAQDRILAVLPFCRKDGFSQMSAAFASSAAVVLSPTRDMRELADVVARERITGLAAAGPLFTRLAQFDWHERHALRYLASCGSLLPPEAVASLRRRLPCTQLFLMHSIGDAFLCTVLAPSLPRDANGQNDRRLLTEQLGELFAEALA